MVFRVLGRHSTHLSNAVCMPIKQSVILPYLGQSFKIVPTWTRTIATICGAFQKWKGCCLSVRGCTSHKLILTNVSTRKRSRDLILTFQDSEAFKNVFQFQDGCLLDSTSLVKILPESSKINLYELKTISLVCFRAFVQTTEVSLWLARFISTKWLGIWCWTSERRNITRDRRYSVPHIFSRHVTSNRCIHSHFLFKAKCLSQQPSRISFITDHKTKHNSGQQIRQLPSNKQIKTNWASLISGCKRLQENLFLR